LNDLLHIVEAAYAATPDREDWLRGLATAALPHLGDGWGVSAWHTDSRGEILAAATVGVPADEPNPYLLGNDLTDRKTAAHYLPLMRAAGPVVSVVALSGEPSAEHDPFGIHRVAHSRGARDLAVFLADTMQDEFVGLGVIRRRPWRMSAAKAGVWRRIAVHVGAGLRLRARSPEPVAILSPNGRLEHASAAVASRHERAAIQQATQRSERARGALRHDDPAQALELWKALVSGRWSLVDHFDSDGRRYILARENEPAPLGPTLLTPRQRAAVKLRAAGRPLKQIGYELGLSVPTISMEIQHALNVLGVKSALDLAGLFAPVVEAGERS
jgi:DNA-binding CsgD family transcriptional regulator